MISTMWYSFSLRTIRLRMVFALARPLETAISIRLPAISSEASLIPSTPLTWVKSKESGSLPVSFSYAVRSAASMTPPVAPKMSAAPELSPRGESNSPSGSAG
jgi:hypothetical protein